MSFLKTMGEVSVEKQVNVCFFCRVATGLVSLFAFIGFFAGGCRHQESGSRQRPLAVRTKPVQEAKIAKTVTYVGTVHSETEVTVLARVGGRVSSLPIAEGQHVKKGQVVARLDAPDLAAGVQQTAAQVRGARAEKEYRCHWAGVHENLSRKGHISQSKADASRKACRAAEAALSAAKAGRRKTAAIQKKTVERAPFDAVVLKKTANRGENTLPGRPLVSLGGEKKEIRAWVTQEDLTAGIEPTSEVMLESEGVTSRMRVNRLAPQANPRTRLFEVGIAVPKPLTERLRHGSAVTVRFILQESRGLVVPVESLRRISGRTEVYRVHEGQAHAVEVAELFRNEELVRVEGALKPGDLLAVTNLSSLRDKTAVLAVSQVANENDNGRRGR